MTTYVVASSKSWNRRVVENSISRIPGRWFFLENREQITAERFAELAPRYVFFLHWSWMVPSPIVDEFECVCFHMTDLPFGRGGTPLQNLIVRGYRETMLTAFKMTDELDAGPIYLKHPLGLDGSAQEIYLRASEVAADMIARIVAEEPEPVPQIGEATSFSRRTPADSEITAYIQDLERLHDHIRMLDAEGYPPAFVRLGPFTLSFRKSELSEGRIQAEVEIRRDTTEER
ncbi:MAG: methionyl-tRNA formyltransferase [Acidobacteriota bacterium]|jgi:methionyl-tRNA formyltransferase|nr:methionyl-tRNA formyltransferase [Acidobacteriota bacterium]